MKVDRGRSSFFGDRALDDGLGFQNAAFWQALLGHVADDFREAPRTILDVGCHDGGLLALVGAQFGDAALIGIEPVEPLRAKATGRLASRRTPTRLLDVDEWHRVPDGIVDLLLGHEVLYLIQDLAGFMQDVHRVLARDGTAYLVTGCHADNPIWPAWRSRLAADGIETHDHRVFDILSSAQRAGLIIDFQPLRRSGWITYDPSTPTFAFPDLQSMLDHHYRHKLMFRLRFGEDDIASRPS